MTITSHAIRRYKQRIGKRTASRRRIIAQINRDLQRDVQYRKPSKIKNHYILVTSKYQAVCYRSKVLTITSLSEDASTFTCAEEVEEAEEMVVVA